MEIVRLLTLIWIFATFIVLFFFLPQKLFPTSKETNFLNKVLSNSLYGLVVIIFAGNLLSILHLFNWFTLLLFYFIWPAFCHAIKNFGKLNELVKNYFINKYLQLLDLLESDNLQKTISEYFDNKKQKTILSLKLFISKLELSNPLIILSLSFFLIIFSFIFGVNFLQPLKEVRFAFIEDYKTLLESWQVLLSEKDNSNIYFLPAILAGISSIAGVDPVHTVSFSSPIILILLILLIAITIWKLTNYKSIALVSIYLLGTNIFYLPKDNKYKISSLPKSFLENILDIFQEHLSQHIFGGKQTLVFIFLLLSIIFYSEIVKEKQELNFNINKRNLVNLLICLLLLGLNNPLLLLPTFLTMLVLTILPGFSLLIFSFSLIMLILFIEINQKGVFNNLGFELILPIAVVLFCSSVCQALIYFSRFLINRYSEFTVATLTVAISIAFLPKQPSYKYLEYDISAKKILEIAQNFPKKRWLVIAPVEGLAISYGYGWYEDLSSFISKYEEKVKEPKFEFSFPLDAFIFVEKKPFVFFEREPKQVPFSTLNDLSYKNYRSPAGRASLEQQAITLCETYKKNHPEMKIYYEDEVLRIYFIPQKTF